MPITPPATAANLRFQPGGTRPGRKACGKFYPLMLIVRTNGFAAILPEKMDLIVSVLPSVPVTVFLWLLTAKKKLVGRIKPMPATILKQKLYPVSAWSLLHSVAVNGLNLTKAMTGQIFIL